MKWLVDRLKERSTWAFFAAALASVGVQLSPEVQEFGGQFLLTVGLGLAAFIPDNK